MVGKITNAALAFKNDPSVIPLVKIVWLGSNYPEPGEYNMENDTVAMNEVLKTPVEFEMVTVRYGLASGTDAVKVTPEEIKQNMPGKGPQVKDSVMGRHQKAFNCFGDYSVNLFEHAEMYGNPPSRALFDMAAVAIVKNPDWAKDTVIACPVFTLGMWIEQPGNRRQIKVWENFDRNSIVGDFFLTMNEYKLAEIKAE
jgi:inosine-uridine nucleoside N-ribohydrolase